jgi:hypothetical protein
MEIKAPPIQPQTQKEDVGKLHRQPRSYLKTSSSITSRDKKGSSLLSDPSYSGVDEKRENITKVAGIVGNKLLEEWQKHKDKRGIYTIKNLKGLASELNMTPQKLKLYLVLLGAYTYPFTTMKKINEKNILSITSKKLFDITFNVRLEEGETENAYNDGRRIGARLTYFIKEKPIESIEVRPNNILIENLNGKGLGNVLVSNEFVPFCLGLSLMAYKIFNFTASNKPKDQQWKLENLIKKEFLNLERQTMKEGKPKVVAKIKKALKELKEKGHLTLWNYDYRSEKFTWNFGDKIIKHRDLHKK